MKTIAFFNVKGGVGKTSTSITVAHILATRCKLKTLIIDLDAQSNATDFFDCYDKDQLTVADALLGTPAEEVIRHTKYENLDIMPSILTLGRVEKGLISDVSAPQQFRLKVALESVMNKYDYCIIDCSPSAESLVNINGLMAADEVYVPLKCDKWSLRGLDATLQIIKTVSGYNSNLKFGSCFFCQWENRNVNKFALETIKESLGKDLLVNRIRKNKDAEEITFAQIALCDYDKKGTATEDYLEFTKMLINK